MTVRSAAILSLWLIAAPCAAQDASGVWQATFNTPNGTRPATLTIKKDGEKLAGSILGDRGEIPFEGTQKGTSVTLAFVVRTGDGTFNITMTGNQDGDALSGMADYGGSAQGEWSARRKADAGPASDGEAAVDLTGTWALEVDTGAGTGTPTATFKQEEGRLTGEYSGQFGQSAVTGTIAEGTFTFNIDITIEGSVHRLVYTGKADRDTMKGRVTLGEFGEGTFTGRRKPE
ncbi:MAG TPA: hypothetical protein VD833_15465 [Vicinamibacterales bacterium]|nr:hypothetical protein [Vicinamibacterales bacterium]